MLGRAAHHHHLCHVHQVNVDHLKEDLLISEWKYSKKGESHLRVHNCLTATTWERGIGTLRLCSSDLKDLTVPKVMPWTHICSAVRTVHTEGSQPDNTDRTIILSLPSLLLLCYLLVAWLESWQACTRTWTDRLVDSGRVVFYVCYGLLITLSWKV